MSELVINNKDETVMKLLHYFITEEGYNPIVIHGSQNEIWLENLDAPYRIIRIMTGHIHNNEQLEFDLYKTQSIIGKIKKKTLSFKMNALSIFIDLEENIELDSSDNIHCIIVKNDQDIIKNSKLKEVFPLLSSKFNFVEEGIQLFTKITNDINEKNKRDAIKNENIFKLKKPYVTYILMALCFLVFFLMYSIGNGSFDGLTLLNFGAMHSQLVKMGQVYRLITAAFVHIGVIHLAFNMYALYLLGMQLESYYGKYRFLFIYIFSAITGSLLSMAFNPNAISAGASGAIFGLLGSLLYFGYHYRVYLGNVMQSRIIPILLLNLFIGFAVTGIDQFAHIGGLAGGVLSSMAVGVKYKSGSYEKTNGIILSILTLLFLLYIAFIYVN